MFKRKELSSRKLPLRQSQTQLETTQFQPRPPSASKRTFVRKHASVNCHTPDEGGGEPILPAVAMKAKLNQSTSPLLLLGSRDRTASPFNSENSPAKPFETRRFIRKQEPTSTANALSRPQLKKVDLKKGSFSAKQIVGGKSIETSMNDSVLNDLQNSREYRPSKRSASPNFNTRNSKFYKLSRAFKLTKAVLGCTSTKQKRTLSDSFKPEDFDLKSLAVTPEPSSIFPCDQLLADLEDIAKPIRNYRRARVLRI
mmetsp:Transcript_6853/g.12448  ORF Transcript_6853/g.12448 Transcript_6853/m.12448 type:complete len:255 (+) Transcript_6853:2699-3463(+)